MLQSTQCPDPMSFAEIPMDCTFYDKCLEATYNCGPEGYPLGYGLKYCDRFKDSYKEFTPQGRKWVQGTLLCLKEALVPLVEDTDG